MPDENLRDAIKTMLVENLMLKFPKEEIGDERPLFGPDGLGLDCEQAASRPTVQLAIRSKDGLQGNGTG